MSQGVRNRIATNVKFYRKKKFLTQEELSLILEVDNSYISKLENANINMTIDKLIQIADFFEIDILDLLK